MNKTFKKKKLHMISEKVNMFNHLCFYRQEYLHILKLANYKKLQIVSPLHPHFRLFILQFIHQALNKNWPKNLKKKKGLWQKSFPEEFWSIYKSLAMKNTYISWNIRKYHLLFPGSIVSQQEDTNIKITNQTHWNPCTLELWMNYMGY